LSLYHVFEQITDERHPRGKCYSLMLILSLLIEGEAGRDDHADRRGPRGSAGARKQLSQVLPGAREQVPCVATYSNVLRAKPRL
jgi:hypothetical protein